MSIEPVAFMFQDDYERMLTSETSCKVYSVEVGNPERGTTTIALSVVPEGYVVVPAEISGWQPIDSAPHQKAVLIHYKNSHGNSRVIKAHFIPKYTVESDCESESYDEYCEEKDTYFCIEGWYELIDNRDEFTAIYVSEGVPDMWHPLPVVESAKEAT